MTTPSDPSTPTSPSPGGSVPPSRVEELRERLRPRAVVVPGGSDLSHGERLALERIQALEMQLISANQREREITELAVRDGNQIAGLEARVRDLTALAERADAAERALFDVQNRAEGAVRRAELMESELVASRSEIDRLRTSVVELEASLRRALAEVGEASTQRARAERAEVEREAARIEESAERSLELADRLRSKVVDLETSLRNVLVEVGDVGSARERVDLAEAERDAARAQAETDRAQSASSRTKAAEAEGRLADLEERLVTLDQRLSEITDTMEHPGSDVEGPIGSGDRVIDIRDPQAATAANGTDEPGEKAKPAPSPWSDWRTT
jgi:chromosome segregation ATPase